jgi:hypothetical protein
MPRSPSAVPWLSLTLLAASTLSAVAQQPPVPADRTKQVVVEAPTRRLVAEKASPVPVAATVNPKVEPGKVNWHPDFVAACAASRKSGKPVLLFQMMGKLDDHFC